jgi:hypothetical protein
MEDVYVIGINPERIGVSFVERGSGHLADSDLPVRGQQ